MEREAFENWYGQRFELDDKWKHRMADGEYADWKVQLAFEAWCTRAKMKD